MSRLDNQNLKEGCRTTLRDRSPTASFVGLRCLTIARHGGVLRPLLSLVLSVAEGLDEGPVEVLL
jgi:hypothetical protein